MRIIMKKTISVILLIAVVFMLEFNLLESVFEKAFRWIEPVLAFAVLIAISVWNNLYIKSE